jgi:hypothetical protein
VEIPACFAITPASGDLAGDGREHRIRGPHNTFRGRGDGEQFGDGHRQQIVDTTAIAGIDILERSDLRFQCLDDCCHAHIVPRRTDIKSRKRAYFGPFRAAIRESQQTRRLAAIGGR